jgi:hypothetical protein
VVLKGVAVLAIALGAFLSCGEETKMAKYRDGRAGWTISYPASMHRSPIEVYEHASELGTVISSFGGIPTDSWLTFRRFPKDGVAFAVLQMGGGPMPDLSPPEQRFPLSRSDFAVVEFAPPQGPLVHRMMANGEQWYVVAWFGPEASGSDKDKIWRIVDSLRFPPLRSGTISGSFYVLEDASHYPVGTVRRFAGKPSAYMPPFFLVHAPGGMYTVSWEQKFEPKCHMAFDRPRFEFYCATHRGRWDRMGRAIDGPASDLQFNDDLSLGKTKIGRDGQVLAGNYWTSPGSYRRYERQFWPRVKPRAASR